MEVAAGDGILRKRPGVPVVRAVERADAILRAFSARDRTLALSEIARRTGLDKSTARRLLHTLESVGWVEFDQKVQGYAIGGRMLTFVPAVNHGRQLREIAAPVLSRLSARAGATSFLWTPFRGQALCLDRVRTPDVLFDVSWSEVGTCIPLNCTGGARIILAHIPAAERRRALAGVMGRFTSLSETDPDRLEADAEAIRKRGWELAVDDYFVGLSGLAAPVFDVDGAFAASISITAPTHRLAPREGRPQQLAEVLDAAAEIGMRLRG